jgi:hypothetical protein
MSKINVDRGIDVAQLFFLTYGTMMKPTSTFQALNEVFYIQCLVLIKCGGGGKSVPHGGVVSSSVREENL